MRIFPAEMKNGQASKTKRNMAIYLKNRRRKFLSDLRIKNGNEDRENGLLYWTRKGTGKGTIPPKDTKHTNFRDWQIGEGKENLMDMGANKSLGGRTLHIYTYAKGDPYFRIYPSPRAFSPLNKKAWATILTCVFHGIYPYEIGFYSRFSPVKRWSMLW